MTTTATKFAAKKDLWRRIRCLSERDTQEALHYIDLLEEEHEPNEETIAAIEDVRAKRNLIGPFDNAKELIDSLLRDDYV